MTDEFEKWLDDEIGNDVYEHGYMTYLARVRAKYRSLKSKDEPLEELAKRKGLTAYVDVQILDNELFPEANFEDSTKARQYLNGLPDKGKK